MADPFSIATGALTVAEVGLKLHKTLKEYVEGVVTADKHFKRITDEVRTTSWALKELGALLQGDDDQDIAIFKPEAKEETRAALEGCEETFRELDLLMKLTKNDANGLTLVGKLKFPGRSKQVKELLRDLERLKTTLLLVCHIIPAAKMAAEKNALPVQDQLQLEYLIKAWKDIKISEAPGDVPKLDEKPLPVPESVKPDISPSMSQEADLAVAFSKEERATSLGAAVSDVTNPPRPFEPLFAQNKARMQTHTASSKARSSDRSLDTTTRSIEDFGISRGLPGLREESTPQPYFTAVTLPSLPMPPTMPVRGQFAGRVPGPPLSERKRRMLIQLEKCATAVGRLSVAINNAATDLQKDPKHSDSRKIGRVYGTTKKAIDAFLDIDQEEFSDDSQSDGWVGHSMLNRERRSAPYEPYYDFRDLQRARRNSSTHAARRSAERRGFGIRPPSRDPYRRGSNESRREEREHAHTRDRSRARDPDDYSPLSRGRVREQSMNQESEGYFLDMYGLVTSPGSPKAVIDDRAANAAVGQGDPISGTKKERNDRDHDSDQERPRNRRREEQREHYREDDRGLGFAFESAPEPQRYRPVLVSDRESDREKDRDNDSHLGEHERPIEYLMTTPLVPDTVDEYRRRMEQVQRELGLGYTGDDADVESNREQRQLERGKRLLEQNDRKVPVSYLAACYSAGPKHISLPPLYPLRSASALRSSSDLARRPALGIQLPSTSAQIPDNSINGKMEKRVRVEDAPPNEEERKARRIFGWQSIKLEVSTPRTPRSNKARINTSGTSLGRRERPGFAWSRRRNTSGTDEKDILELRNEGAPEVEEISEDDEGMEEEEVLEDDENSDDNESPDGDLDPIADLLKRWTNVV